MTGSAGALEGPPIIRSAGAPQEAPAPSAPCAPPTPSATNGFTLIELLVIIVIMGILIAVAIPIFRRQTNLAKEISAEAMLKGMGGVTNVAFSENLDAAEIAAEVALGTRTSIRVACTAGASSTGPNEVVALVPNGEDPGE